MLVAASFTEVFHSVGPAKGFVNIGSRHSKSDTIDTQPARK